MSRSRVILLAVVLLATAAFFALRSCEPEGGKTQPDREGPARTDPSPRAPDATPPAAVPMPEDLEPPSPVPGPGGEPASPQHGFQAEPAAKPGPVLVVVDAESGAPLPNPDALATHDVGRHGSITLTSRRGVGMAHLLPRSAYGRLHGDPSGRIRVPGGEGTRGLFVGADGHAWVFVEVPVSLEGEIRVPLPSGGTLRLRILQFDELRDPQLSAALSGIEGRLRLPGPGKDGEALISGLAAGTWTIQVREGREGEVAGEGEVAILPGATVELTIDARPSADSRAEVSGTITVPDGWRTTPSHLSFQDRNGEPKAVASPRGRSDGAAERTYTFSGVRLEPGEYFAVIPAFQWRAKITVPPNGARLDLRVPKPVELRVRVIDAVSGEKVRAAEVAWYAHVEGLFGYTLEDVPFDEVSGVFRFQAPPGTIGLDVMADGHIEEETYVDAVAGKTHEAEIRLERAAVLTVRFKLDGEPFPAEDIVVNLTTMSERGEEWNSTEMRRGEGASVVFPDLVNGTVEVSVDPPAGFRPVKPETIEVRQGESCELVFDLERE